MVNNIPVETMPKRKVCYAQPLEDAATLEIDGRRIPVASLEAIIRSKEIIGRPEDREAPPALYELRDRQRERIQPGREIDPPDLGLEL